jgi:hypothetical protein
MTPQMAVAASPEADAAGDVAQVIASLPVSLHPASRAPDLVAIDGGTAGWPDEAERQIGTGVRGIMVINPVAADVTALKEKSSAAAVPVVIDSTWTYNPAVATGKGHFAAHNDTDSLLEARVNLPAGTDLDQALLAQLGLIRETTGQVTSLMFARKDRHGYDALATLASGGRASLTAIFSDSVPPSAVLRIIKPRTAVELTLPGPATAAPGKVVVSGPKGATLLTTLYETAHRAAWRNLYRLAQSGETAGDLAGFARDLLALRTAH